MSRSSIFLFAILICTQILILATAPDVIGAPADLCGDTCWVGHESGSVGSIVAVPITFKNCTELSGMAIPLMWAPDAVTLESIDFAGSRVDYVGNKSDATNIDNVANTAMLYAILSSEEPIAAGEGLFATLYFRIDAVSGEPVLLDTAFIPPIGYYLFSEPDATTVPTEFIPGSINVACDCGVWGDVNGDGNINPVDVVFMVNKVYRGRDWIVQHADCPRNSADVTCDGNVNPVDVVFFVNKVYRGRDKFCPDPCGP